MKGIILAGGLGTRLYPLTISTSKQLLPIYDKPMIYYSLSVLMQAGIQEILLITTSHDLPRFRDLLGDGSALGLQIEYEVQAAPRGIAEAFIIGESFIGSDNVCLILGDNIFYGHNLKQTLKRCTAFKSGAVVLAYEVDDPERYGVVDFDQQGRVKAIVEKPKVPPSSYAVTGLYFYDKDEPQIAKTLTPSARGELEITDLTNAYLQMGKLQVERLERGFAWLDTGTIAALQSAAHYIQTMQERQGIKVACLEEIALEMGFITKEQFTQLAQNAPASEYGNYLRKIARHEALTPFII